MLPAGNVIIFISISEKLHNENLITRKGSIYMFTILFAAILIVIELIISIFSKELGMFLEALIPYAVVAFVVIFVIYTIIASFAFGEELNDFEESRIPIKLFVLITIAFLVLGSIAQALNVPTFALELVGCIALLITALTFVWLFFLQAEDSGIKFFKAIPRFFVQEIKCIIFFGVVVIAFALTIFQLIIALFSWTLFIIFMKPIILRFKDLFIVKAFSKC
jgi:hypothetical protein